MQAQIATFGPLQSGTRVYQANFLPATLATATTLASVLATKPAAGCASGTTSNVYCANQGLDSNGNGTIEVSDLAHFVAKEAAIPAVAAVIASAYAAAPSGAGAQTDATYGTDWTGASSTAVAASVTAAAPAVASSTTSPASSTSSTAAAASLGSSTSSAAVAAVAVGVIGTIVALAVRAG
jgi:hypothetical protein